MESPAPTSEAISEPAPEPAWPLLDVLGAVAAFAFAGTLRGFARVRLELPSDGAPMIHRALDMRDGIDLPLVGNLVVGWPFHFGVFDDWYRALLSVGVDDLASLTDRLAWSHGAIAAWAWLLCARLGTRGAGCVLVALLAFDEHLLKLAWTFPTTYRTAEWGLLLGVALAALTVQHPARGSRAATVAALLAAALVVPSHPFAAAAALPAVAGLLRWGRVPGLHLGAAGALGVLILAGPWAVDVLMGLPSFLQGEFASAGGSTTAISLNPALATLANALALSLGPAAGPALEALLGAGLLLAAVHRHLRPLLFAAVLWCGGLIGLLAVAGFQPRTYHLSPPLLLLLTCSLAGLDAGISALVGRWTSRNKSRAASAVLGALAAGAILLGPAKDDLVSLAAARDAAPPHGLGETADDVSAEAVRLLQGEPGLFAYAWAERRHHDLAWAVPLSMRLATGDPEAGQVKSGAIILAVLSRELELSVSGFTTQSVVVVGQGEWVHLARVDGPLAETWAIVCGPLGEVMGRPLQLHGAELPVGLGPDCPDPDSAR